MFALDIFPKRVPRVMHAVDHYLENRAKSKQVSAFSRAYHNGPLTILSLAQIAPSPLKETLVAGSLPIWTQPEYANSLMDTLTFHVKGIYQPVETRMSQLKTRVSTALVNRPNLQNTFSKLMTALQSSGI